MKNIIHDWLSNKSETKANEEPEDNTISFTVDKNGIIKINLIFESNSLEDANNLGKFLYELNSGIMSQSVIDLMIELGKDNPTYQIFIKNAIMSWFNQLPKSSDSKDIEHADNPVIKPSEFMNTAFKGN